MAIQASLFNRLKNQYEGIRPLVAPLQREHIMQAPAPGKWSIHDNITHLAKYQPEFSKRIYSMLTVNEPAFERYSAETDDDFERWRKWDTEKVLNRLYADREDIFGTISTLSDEQLQRAGYHPRFGKMPVWQWTEFFLLHEAHHMYTIFQLGYAKK